MCQYRELLSRSAAHPDPRLTAYSSNFDERRLRSQLPKDPHDHPNDHPLSRHDRGRRVLLLTSGLPFLGGLGIITGCFVLLWLLSLVLGNAGIVDIFWGPGFVVAGVFYLMTLSGEPTPRGILVVALTTLWAARLALHIGIRSIGAPEDFRYRKWREECGSPLLVDLASQGLPASGGAALDRLVAAAARATQGPASALTTKDLVGIALFVDRFRLRGGRRLAAGFASNGPIQPRPDPPNRALGPNPPPELLRRSRALVGTRPARRAHRRLARPRRTDTHHLSSHEGLGSGHARRGPRRPTSRIRRLHPVDTGLLPPTASETGRFPRTRLMQGTRAAPTPCCCDAAAIEDMIPLESE